MSNDVKELFSMDLAGDPTGVVAAAEGGGRHRVLRAAAGPPRGAQHPAVGETGTGLCCSAHHWTVLLQDTSWEAGGQQRHRDEYGLTTDRHHIW